MEEIGQIGGIMQELLLFNNDWKFHFGDIVSVRNRWAWAKSGSFNQGPESIAFDDLKWREVRLPHDFVFETTPYDYSEKEFDEDNAIPEMEDVNNIHTTAGSFDKNVGWYRKHFFIPKEYEGKKLFLIFDGIYRDATFFLNEFYLEHEPSGYSRIVIDITDTSAYGKENVLAIRCDAREAEGWFYEGGGIYRNVYLKVVEKEYIDDLFVYGELKQEFSSAEINVSGRIYGISTRNYRTEECSAIKESVLKLKVFDAEDKLVKEVSVELSDTDENECNWVYSPHEGCIFFENRIEISKPRLWSVDEPTLYKLVCELETDGETKNQVTKNFGIRTAQFDNEKGFLLNGKQLKIKGVCCHQNHGGLGNAVPKEVVRYRIKKLKEMGANGYRGAHYPLTEDFLDICDREGMLVMLETRLLSSAKPDMYELERMVKLGRNHPSVIIYSIGNEEAQSQATEQGARIASTMIDFVKRIDPYRPVTMALLMLDMKTNTPITDYKVLEGISKQLDVAGFNYHSDLYEKFHEEYPWQPFICTEQGTFKSTRGCYETDKEKCHLAINEKRPYYMLGAQRWRECKPDWVSGLFIWTGFDYYGEPTPFAWPAISSQFGAMDLCGNPKDFYYFYKAWWTDKDVIHAYPDMDQEPGKETDYYVFSNAEEVELILNGRSLGKKTMPLDDYLVWENILSEHGTMEVIGYRNGQEVMRSINKTSDASTARLQITEDYRENDIVIRKLELLDAKGTPVTNADVKFDIPLEWGELLGASNGNPTDHTAGKAGYVNTFHGLAQVIVREKED
jgi:beta-galactosidase